MSNEEALEKLWKCERLSIPISMELEAFRVGVKALEKQIPKKVIVSKYNAKFCPVCNDSVWQIRDESKYCFRCGQRLDWSNT